MRIVHREHDLVGVPVAHKIHGSGDQQSDQRATLPTDQKPDAHEQGS